MRPNTLRKYANDIRNAVRFGVSDVGHATYPVDCFEDALAPLVARLLEDEADRMEQEQCCQRALSSFAAADKDRRWCGGPSPLNEHDAAVERAAARQARKISGAE